MRLAHVETSDISSTSGAVRSLLIREHYLCQLYCSGYKSCSSVGLQAKVKKKMLQSYVQYSVERSQLSATGVTYFQHVISHDAFGLDEDLVDHGVTMITVHLMDAVLVEFGQGQQHLQGQGLGLFTVAHLHRLSSTDTEGICEGFFFYLLHILHILMIIVTVKMILHIVSYIYSSK